MSGDGGTDLEQRVKELEEKNRQLAAQVARFVPDGPSRRDVLKYGATAFAAAGVGSLATGGAVGDASESDGDGDVGTPSNRVDLFADGVDANSVDANDLVSNEGNALDWNPPYNRAAAVGFHNIGPTTDAGSWSKDANNPVITEVSGTWRDNRTIGPEIWREQDTYYLLYVGNDEGSGGDTLDDIGLATSTDLSNWSHDSANPVFEEAGSGWDGGAGGGVWGPTTVKEGNTYKLWYTGTSDGYSGHAIGLATSTDLVNWTRDGSNPVLEPSGSGWDSSRVRNPSVIRVGDTYHMLYWGSDGSTNQIGHATSQDGTTWSKNSNNPVISPGSGWDSNKVIEPELTLVGDKLHAYYRGGDGTVKGQIGHAVSDDGSTWRKSANNPVVPVSGSGWDSDQVFTPSLVQIGGTWELMYAGYGGDTSRIGHATLDLTVGTGPA